MLLVLGLIIKLILYKVNFSEGLSQLKFFVPKTTQPRGQPFSFELAKDFSIKMQMYIKNVETSMKLSFDPVSKSLDNDQIKVIFNLFNKNKIFL